jgi:hypothetical protein
MLAPRARGHRSPQERPDGDVVRARPRGRAASPRSCPEHPDLRIAVRTTAEIVPRMKHLWRRGALVWASVRVCPSSAEARSRTTSRPHAPSGAATRFGTTTRGRPGIGAAVHLWANYPVGRPASRSATGRRVAAGCDVRDTPYCPRRGLSRSRTDGSRPRRGRLAVADAWRAWVPSASSRRGRSSTRDTPVTGPTTPIDRRLGNASLGSPNKGQDSPWSLPMRVWQGDATGGEDTG